MKKYLVLIIIAVFSHASIGQQNAQFSQYMHSKFLINPAAIGISGKLNFAAGYRDQWSGFPNAVNSYFLGGNYTLGNEHNRSYIDKSIRVSNPDLFKSFDSTGQDKHVVGAYFTGNNFAPVSATSANALYAYHYPIDEFYISMGAAVNYNTYNINFDDIELFEINDSEYNGFLAQNNNTGFLDMSFGAMVYSTDFYFGYSINRIAPNQIRLTSDASQVTISTRHYVSAGAKFDMNESIVLKPSVLVRGVNNAPASFDVNLIAEYNKYLTAGIAYRNGDAIVVMGGVTFNQHYALNYAYDITTSTLSSVSNGSHEILLSAKF